MVTIKSDSAVLGVTELCGLSTDTKPTTGIAENALFLELDSGDFYFYSGDSWSKVGGN